MLIAQITDPHVMRSGKLVYGALDSTAHLARAIDRLNTLEPRPDVVLITGDLVDAGSAEEYARLRAELDRLAMPYRLIPGNHDARDTLRAAFPEQPWPRDAAFCHYVDDAWPLRLIGLDSLVPGEVAGWICAQRRDWLARQLAAAPERPTLIFVHHPPFATGIAHMDALPLREADAFARVVSAHRNVVRVISGHVHRAMSAMWGGTLCTTCPSTAHQFALDLVPEKIVRWAAEPPGFQLHRYAAGIGLVTHTGVIGDYPPATLAH
jgi:3',5'-cyclic-AMP phosphodiesterase